LPRCVSPRSSSRFVPVGDQQEGFPGRLAAVLELSVRGAERVQSQFLSAVSGSARAVPADRMRLSPRPWRSHSQRRSDPAATRRGGSGCTISPRRQHVWRAPIMRSCIVGHAHLCSAEFIVTHAARSRCSSSRWIRLSRSVSSRALMVTPKRWNGVVESSGGSWNRPQLIAARSMPKARLTVASLRPCPVLRFEAADVSRFLQRRHRQTAE
jgi:hypothetical protein